MIVRKWRHCEGLIAKSILICVTLTERVGRTAWP